MVREDGETAVNDAAQPHLSACATDWEWALPSQQMCVLITRLTCAARCGGHLNIAQIMRGEARTAPSAALRIISQRYVVEPPAEVSAEDALADAWWDTQPGRPLKQQRS